MKSLRFALLAVENPVPVSPMIIPLYNLAGPPSSSCLPLSCTPSTMASHCGQELPPICLLCHVYTYHTLLSFTWCSGPDTAWPVFNKVNNVKLSKVK